MSKKKENIQKFINNNSNQDGLDLTKLHLGRIVYNKGLEIDKEEQQLANKIAIVYIVDNSENNSKYMDLFRGILIETKTFTIPGILSFAPFVSEGLSIIDLIKLSDLLKIERLPIKKIEKLYNELEKINYYDTFGMTVNDFHNLYDNQIGVRK